MPGENRETPEQAAPLTRREAMLQLLRVGGIAAGAGAAGLWLSEHSFRPVPVQADQARRDHRTVADPQFPHLVVAYYSMNNKASAESLVARAGEPRALVQRAIEDLGGMRRFVSRQDVVV